MGSCGSSHFFSMDVDCDVDLTIVNNIKILFVYLNQLTTVLYCKKYLQVQLFLFLQSGIMCDVPGAPELFNPVYDPALSYGLADLA